MFSQGLESDRTNLRAEVPPFVPRREWTEESMDPQSGRPLPRYVTTCYPFVQDNQDERRMQHGANFNQRFPTPALRNGTTYANVGYLDSSSNSAAFTNANQFAMGTVSQNFSGLPFEGNLADTAHITAVYGDSIQCQYSPNPSSVVVHKSSSLKTRSRGSSGKRILKRNVGTQKEANRGSPSPELVDNCQQTDFPISIASKSLTDHPSLLRKPGRSRRRRETLVYTSGAYDSSSDHADVDSDSGYYSPKHRLVHAKSGGTSTHGLNARNEKDSVPQVIYITPSNVSAHGPMFQVHPSSATNHLFHNSLSPHVTPPPTSLLGYGQPGPPIIFSPPPNPMLANRPSPGFPLHPSLIQTSNGNQGSSTSNWNTNMAFHAGYWSNGPNPFHHQQNFRNPSLDPRSQRKFNKFDNRSKSPSYGGHINYHQGKPSTMERQLRDDSPIVLNSHNDPSINGLHLPEDNTLFMLSDNQEFPGLGGNLYTTSTSAPGNVFSYSAAVMGKIPRSSQSNVQNQVYPPSNSNEKAQAQKSKKRRKKAERAAKAADEEYAEISKEHENIQKVFKKTASGRNKSKTPVLDFSEVMTKLEEKKIIDSSQKGGASEKLKDNAAAKKPPLNIRQTAVSMITPMNALDGTAPMIKKGKEREVPKVKKPSALKKVILKEREEKKEHHLKQLTTMPVPAPDVPPYPASIYRAINTTDESKGETVAAPDSVDIIPATVPQIHSRRYREYCCQVLDKRIDETCTMMLQKLVQFQDRLFQKDPMKAKRKRRLVMGLREVTKHLKMKKLRCIFISPNLEKIQAKGGLDDALQQILNLCEEQNVTYVFALGRKALGRAVSKMVPVSIVGVFDYSGAEEQYKQLVELVTEAQVKYKEMVSIYQQEVMEANQPAQTSGGASKRFAHMTHSRNPSAASCVSFASFISEPISEMNEASNWRVMMDTGEEVSALSPPPEDDASDEEEAEKDQTESHVRPQEPEVLSRKDSGSTVVERLSEVEHEDQLESTKSNQNEDSIASKDDKDVQETSANHRRALDKSFSTCSTTKPDSVIPPPRQSNSDASSLIPDDVSSQSSAHDRIHLWLEDATRSVADLDLNEQSDGEQLVSTESILDTKQEESS